MNTTPITIVSGLPRSGTSLMMQMIVAAGIQPLTDNLRTADVENPNGYLEFEPVKTTSTDPSWLPSARGKVVKMVHILLLELPPGGPYRIVMMHRELDEVLASQRTMLRRAGRDAPAISAEALKRTYAAQLDTVRRFISGRADMALLEVSYNQLLADPLQQAARIAAFLQLDDAVTQMAAAVDPSLYRNRQA